MFEVVHKKRVIGLRVLLLLVSFSEVLLFASESGGLAERERLLEYAKAPPASGEMLFSFELFNMKKGVPEATAYYWARWDGDSYIVKQFSNPSGTNSPLTASYESLCVFHDGKYRNFFSDIQAEQLAADTNVESSAKSVVTGAWETCREVSTLGLLPAQGVLVSSSNVNFTVLVDGKQYSEGRVVWPQGKSDSPEAVVRYEKMPGYEFVYRYAFGGEGGNLFPCSYTVYMSTENALTNKPIMARAIIFAMRTSFSQQETFDSVLDSVLPKAKLREYVYSAAGPFQKKGTNLIKVEAPDPPTSETIEKRNFVKVLMITVFAVPLVALLLWRVRGQGRGK